MQLPQKQIEELERLSLMGFSDILIRSETDESIIEDELSGLALSAIRSRFCENFALSEYKFLTLKKHVNKIHIFFNTIVEY